MPESDTTNAASSTPTPVEVQVAKEAVPDAHAALWAIGLALAVSLANAIGEFINQFLPALSTALSAQLPTWAVGGSAVVAMVLSMAAAGLLKWAKSKTQSAVVTALKTDTPAALTDSSLYYSHKK